jgi:hypothetical protein
MVLQIARGGDFFGDFPKTLARSVRRGAGARIMETFPGRAVLTRSPFAGLPTFSRNRQKHCKFSNLYPVDKPVENVDNLLISWVAFHLFSDG